MRAFALAIILALQTAACEGEAVSKADLEERVQRLEDERDISEVLVLYGEHLDAKDYADYASLFAADGIAVTGFGAAAGPAAIEALLEKNLGRPEPGYVNKERFHLMTTMIIDVSGDAAAARSRYTVFAASPQNKPEAVHSGRYADEFVRENGVWRIKTRTSHGVIPYREPARPDDAVNRDRE